MGYGAWDPPRANKYHHKNFIAAGEQVYRLFSR
jgi:hypothetical protein